MNAPGKRNLLFISLALLINLGILFGSNLWFTQSIHVSLPADQISTQLDFSKKQSVASRPATVQASRANRPDSPKDMGAPEVKPLAPPLDPATPGSFTSPDAPAPPNEIQAYLREVVRIINRKKRYPRLSRQNGEQGQVLVRLVIGKSGELLSYKILKKSPHERLDHATTTTVRSASYPPLPESLGMNKLVIEIPVRYRLSQNRG